jgi:hypothetical protein
MLVRHIGGFGETLVNTPVGQDRLWNRPVAQVSESEIQLFYARMALAGHRQEAIDAIDRLQAICVRLAVEGKGQGLEAIILHVPPDRRFYVDELIDGLSKLTHHRRLACLYALEMKDAPLKVAGLTWRQVPMDLTDLAQEVVTAAAQTRHIRLPYVFWEWATEKIGTPLLDLESSITEAFECSWPALAQRYENIIKIDRRADSASFLLLIEDVLRKSN